MSKSTKSVTSATVNPSENTEKSGKVQRFPFGTMKPGDALITAITGLATLAGKLATALSRKETKRQIAVFYGKFKAKYPDAILADFARQFSADVPQDRTGYKVHATFIALENMFRYMPELKRVNAKGKLETEAETAKRIATAKAKTKKRKAQAVTLQSRGIRLLIAIAHQIGIPRDVFAIAAQKVGYSADETTGLWDTKGSLVDVGLGTYQLAVRTTGVSAIKAYAQRKVKDTAAAQAIPTPAELQSAEKAKVSVQTVSSSITNGRTTTVLPTKVYKGKGQYQRVTTLKQSDNLSSAPLRKR